MTGYQPARQETVAELLGDAGELVEQLGSAGGLAALTREPGLGTFKPATDLTSLRHFLRDYQTRILGPIELPSIQRAFHYASRHQVRELIELDQQIAGEPLLECFAAASRQVGKGQITRLRPLRDQRLLQRYLAAVQSGTAHGWHTVVYGLILSLYSMPLRPGLLAFAEQTTRGFIYSTARRLSLSEIECRDLIVETSSVLPGAVDQVLGPDAHPDNISALC